MAKPTRRRKVDAYQAPILPNAVYDVDQTCQLTGTSRTTLWRWVRAGKLRRLDVGFLVRFSGADILDALGLNRDRAA